MSANSKLQDGSAKKVIYDFGSNNGDDIPYYLMRADIVVAVEANPTLCEGIRRRFKAAIDSGKLVIENCVLTANEHIGAVPFYIHKQHHVLSRAHKPPAQDASKFEECLLTSVSALDIVKKYGCPYYIKVDLEGFDEEILRALLCNGITPPYISTEFHSADVFCVLVSLGDYASFKLVEGHSVSEEYRDCVLDTAIGPHVYSFPRHSAGPFGNDIKGCWMTKSLFFQYLAHVGFGWRDIHASKVDAPEKSKVRGRNQIASSVICGVGRRLNSPRLKKVGRRLWGL